MKELANIFCEQKKKLTHFKEWLGSLENSVIEKEDEAFKVPDFPPVLQKVLKYCRIFLYD